jgi:hypothetical protein
MQALMKTSGCEVQEKANMVEALTAALGAEVEMANKYNVLDDSGKAIFFAKESTDCCTRQLKSCFGDCAPWELDMWYLPDGSDQPAFYLKREWTCTCCCLNRPKITMTDAAGETLGSIQDPFACCNLTFTIRDESDESIATIEGGCCQWGLCCPLPCGPCATVEFDVKDSEGNDIGHLEKKVPGCCKFCFASDVENYKVDWEGVEDPIVRALLMAATIFIDFRYFNDNKNDQ